MQAVLTWLTSATRRLSSPWRRSSAYALAVLLVAGTAVVRWMLNPLLGDSVPHLLFMPAVVLAALVGGLGPGLVATVLAAAIGTLLWVGPPFSLPFASSDEMVHACTALVVGTAISFLSDAMHRASRAEQEANAAKDRFIAVLSHELRQPLTTMVAAVETLKLHPEGGSETEQTLEVLSRNLELHALLVNDLLDVNRIAAGKMHLQQRVCDLRDVVKAAWGTCREEMESKGIAVRTCWPQEPCWVDADPARLQQVFWNLLRNATKFTPGGGTVTIEIVCEEQEVRATVRDTGIGIAREKLPMLFKAFEQAHGELSTRLGGLGLGLAICQGIVRSHGGRIEVASDGIGKGAAFSVTMARVAQPVIPDDMQDATVPLRPRPRQHERPRGGQMRILLVEDQAETRQLLARLLRRAGYEVATAGGVESAVAMARQSIDLLISDMVLPDGTGVELLERLGDHRPGKAICLSGAGSPEDVARSSHAGFQRHLTKPVQLPQLQRTIGELLGE